MTRTAILLRSNRFGAREAAFLQRLGRESGYPTWVLADETRGALDTAGVPKVALSPAVLRRLGLRRTADFGWRCGDYGFYAARAALPEVERFWMIEPDVRACLPDWGEVFGPLDRVEADLLAFHLRPSERAHFWYPTMRWVTASVQRCDFAFTRLGARAIDACLAERRRLARLPPSWVMWPNDETFTATTVLRLGMTARDIDGCGRRRSTPDSFGFARPHRGEALDAAAHDGLLYHPVLWGADYERKAVRVARGVSRSEAVRLKLLRALARAQSAAGRPSLPAPVP